MASFKAGDRSTTAGKVTEPLDHGDETAAFGRAVSSVQISDSQQRAAEAASRKRKVVCVVKNL